MNMQNAEYYMKLALAEAQLAAEEDEVPVGAVIVKDGEVIARAHNQREQLQMPYAHAEMMAIQLACKKLGTWCLQDCDLYVTLEPCMMCTGLIQQARINRLFYGTQDPKGGTVDTLVQIKLINHLNTYPRQIYKDILHDECAEVLSSFFRHKRQLQKEEKARQNKD